MILTVISFPNIHVAKFTSYDDCGECAEIVNYTCRKMFKKANVERINIRVVDND